MKKIILLSIFIFSLNIVNANFVENEYENQTKCIKELEKIYLWKINNKTSASNYEEKYNLIFDKFIIEILNNEKFKNKELHFLNEINRFLLKNEKKYKTAFFKSNIDIYRSYLLVEVYNKKIHEKFYSNNFYSNNPNYKPQIYLNDYCSDLIEYKYIKETLLLEEINEKFYEYFKEDKLFKKYTEEQWFWILSNEEKEEKDRIDKFLNNYSNELNKHYNNIKQKKFLNSIQKDIIDETFWIILDKMWYWSFYWEYLWASIDILEWAIKLRNEISLKNFKEDVYLNTLVLNSDETILKLSNEANPSDIKDYIIIVNFVNDKFKKYYKDNIDKNNNIYKKIVNLSDKDLSLLAYKIYYIQKNKKILNF